MDEKCCYQFCPSTTFTIIRAPPVPVYRETRNYRYERYRPLELVESTVFETVLILFRGNKHRETRNRTCNSVVRFLSPDLLS